MDMLVDIWNAVLLTNIFLMRPKDTDEFFIRNGWERIKTYSLQDESKLRGCSLFYIWYNLFKVYSILQFHHSCSSFSC
jgi:hypothetical protein